MHSSSWTTRKRKWAGWATPKFGIPTPITSHLLRATLTFHISTALTTSIYRCWANSSSWRATRALFLSTTTGRRSWSAFCSSLHQYSWMCFSSTRSSLWLVRSTRTTGITKWGTASWKQRDSLQTTWITVRRGSLMDLICMSFRRRPRLLSKTSRQISSPPCLPKSKSSRPHKTRLRPK